MHNSEDKTPKQSRALSMDEHGVVLTPKEVIEIRTVRRLGTKTD